jgi:hypothetical protein
VEGGLGEKASVYDVSLSGDVEALKVMIGEKTGVPVSKQCLFYGGRALSEGISLSSYGVAEHSTIFLSSLRMRGGSGGETPENPWADLVAENARGSQS